MVVRKCAGYLDGLVGDFVRYTPSKDAPGRNPNIKQRVIKVVEVQKDPMEPPKFRHHKVPARNSLKSKIVQVANTILSPKRAPATGAEIPSQEAHQGGSSCTRSCCVDAIQIHLAQMWKIPPCVSNWKNAKGYVIPLDKRIAADGRGLQVVDFTIELAEGEYTSFCAC